jgi:hypothetical protein
VRAATIHILGQFPPAALMKDKKMGGIASFFSPARCNRFQTALKLKSNAGVG